MRDQGLSILAGLTVEAVLRDERNRVEVVHTPDGRRAVRKTLRDEQEYALERTALAHTTSHDASVRVVGLLAHDDASRTLLLEHAAGERLDVGWPDARPDVEVTADLARAMRALWHEPATDAIGLREWMRALWRPVPPNPVLSSAQLARAAAEAEELLAGPAPIVQLHGDLHHENVFRTPDGHLTVLDPKNLAGHPAFDTVAQIWNPIGRVLRHPDPAGLVGRRVDVLAAELRMDTALLRAWIRVGCILSTAWYFEHGPEPDAEALGSAADCVRIADLLTP